MANVHNFLCSGQTKPNYLESDSRQLGATNSLLITRQWCSAACPALGADACEVGVNRVTRGANVPYARKRGWNNREGTTGSLVLKAGHVGINTQCRPRKPASIGQSVQPLCNLTVVPTIQKLFSASRVDRRRDTILRNPDADAFPL